MLLKHFMTVITLFLTLYMFYYIKTFPNWKSNNDIDSNNNHFLNHIGLHNCVGPFYFNLS